MPFCKNCGNALDEDVKFCPNCGTAVSAQPEQEVQQAEHYQQQYIQPEQIQTAAPVQTPSVPDLIHPKLILTLGIIAAAVSWIPFLGIGGIIVGAIGMSKSNAYANSGGVPCGMSITGRILSRVGLISGICFAAFWAIYFIAIASCVSYYSGYIY